MREKRSTVTVKTEFLVLNSKTPCPECGGKQWLPYVYEYVQDDFVPLGKQVFNVDAEPIIDKAYDNLCIDECLGCGIAISCFIKEEPDPRYDEEIE